MKTLKIIVAALMILLTVGTHAQQFVNVNSAGGTGSDRGYDIDKDSYGNTYVCGWFSETAHFGDVSFDSFGEKDIFIACYDTTGALKWVKQAGSEGTDVAAGIVTNSDGYSYLTGWYSSTADFDTHSITSAGSYDMFVAKYDPEGNCLWAKSGGGTADDYGNRLTLTNDGGVCVGGSFRETISVGSHSLTSMGNRDILLAHFSADGEAVCAKSAGGTGEDRAYGIYQDDDSNYYLTGFYSGTAYFDDIESSSPSILSSFVARLDQQGNFQWVRSAGGGANDFARGFSIVPDNEGNIITTGFFSDRLTVDDITIFASGGTFDFDIYILKFDNNGTLLWGKNAGGYGTDHARDLYVDADGKIYVTGFFSGTAYFDGITAEAIGKADVFMARYNNDGSSELLVTGGGTDNDYGFGIAGDNWGNLALSGSFYGEAVFGNTTLGSAGANDIFSATIPGASLGIGHKPAARQLFVYPNPASEQLTVHTGNLFRQGELLRYRISDTSGKIRLSSSQTPKTSNDGILLLDISSLNPGAYVIKIFSDNYSLLAKFVVEK